jgi:hypothetical protein
MEERNYLHIKIIKEYEGTHQKKIDFKWFYFYNKKTIVMHLDKRKKKKNEFHAKLSFFHFASSRSWSLWSDSSEKHSENFGG